jgi:hypothetical protein
VYIRFHPSRSKGDGSDRFELNAKWTESTEFLENNGPLNIVNRILLVLSGHFGIQLFLESVPTLYQVSVIYHFNLDLYLK